MFIADVKIYKLAGSILLMLLKDIINYVKKNWLTNCAKGTAKFHSMAENVSFVKLFLVAIVDRNSYCALVVKPVFCLFCY